MLRDEVWKQLNNAERLFRYYYELSQYYDVRERRLRGTILFSYIAGASAIFEVIPREATFVFAPLVIVATVWDMTMRYGEKAALLRVICTRCDRLLGQWKELWVELEDEVIENDSLWMKYRYLRDEETASSQLSVLFGIKKHERISEEAEEEAYSYTEKSY